VKRIVAEGHSVCNHSMTHPQPFSGHNPAMIHQQIADAQSAIADAGGVSPRLFRAPGGDWSARVLTAVQDFRMAPLGWDIDPRDWSQPGTGSVTSRLLAAQPGDILLCHDGGGTSPPAAGWLPYRRDIAARPVRSTITAHDAEMRADDYINKILTALPDQAHLANPFKQTYAS
jgi:peptidoglycan/xylan/chitin deacetylase (PgdA/CDA1 family)